MFYTVLRNTRKSSVLFSHFVMSSTSLIIIYPPTWHEAHRPPVLLYTQSALAGFRFVVLSQCASPQTHRPAELSTIGYVGGKVELFERVFRVMPKFSEQTYSVLSGVLLSLYYMGNCYNHSRTSDGGSKTSRRCVLLFDSINCIIGKSGKVVQLGTTFATDWNTFYFSPVFVDSAT